MILKLKPSGVLLWAASGGSQKCWDRKGVNYLGWVTECGGGVIRKVFGYRQLSDQAVDAVDRWMQ